MDKELLKSAFEAGQKYWSDIQTDEPNLFQPVNFEDWYEKVALKKRDETVGDYYLNNLAKGNTNN